MTSPTSEAEPKGGWPCTKHKAHGPHGIAQESEGFYTCPGVKAHPNTMIGRNHG